MKIKFMEIKNFKAFKEVKIDFTSNKNGAEEEIELDFVAPTKDNKKVISYLNYIIGRNSIGKTSILDAIEFFTNFVCDKQNEKAKKQLLYFFRWKEIAKEKNQINDWFRKKNKIIKEINEGKHIEAINQRKKIIYKNQYLKYARNNKDLMEIKISFDQKKDFYAKLIYPSPETSKIFYEPFFEIKNSTNELINELQIWSKNTLELIEIRNNYSEKLNLYHYYNNYNIEDNNYNIKEIIEEFNKNDLINLNDLIKLANPQFIEFIADDGAIRYTEKNLTLPKSLRTLSSGTKRFLELLYLILQFAKNKSGILLFDEIDNYLHKELVNVIKIGMLIIAKKYDLQIILTTHNPMILKEFVSNKQIISLDDEKSKVVATKVSSKIKPRNSIIKKYENNDISMFPEPEHAKKISINIFKKW